MQEAHFPAGAVMKAFDCTFIPRKAGRIVVPDIHVIPNTAGKIKTPDPK
ncbi:MAG: hypothetical protein AB9903_35915 [Vulcanimicrobiota bacterium]